MEEEEAKEAPFPAVDQATQTEFGRSSIRLRTWAAMATSVALASSLWKRSPSPMTCFQRANWPSTPSPLIIAAVPLPGQSPLVGDLLDVAVALGGVGVRRGAEHGIGTRWNHHATHNLAKLPFDLSVTVERALLHPLCRDGLTGALLKLDRLPVGQMQIRGADGTAQNLSVGSCGPGELRDLPAE